MICQALHNVMLLLVKLFRLAVQLLTGVQDHLAELRILEILDYSATAEALFAQLRPFLGATVTPLPPGQEQQGLGAGNAWKRRCFEALHVGASEEDPVPTPTNQQVKEALSVYVTAMKQTLP